MKIRAYVNYDERSNTRYHRDFTIEDYKIKDLEVEDLDELIKNTTLNSWLDNETIINIQEVNLDCEQGNNEVFDYDYYCIKKVDIGDYHQDYDEDKDINDYINYEYVAIKIED